MNAIGAGVLVVMMMLTVSDVFMRKTFSQPIAGTMELTELMMVCVVYLALAWCAIGRAHVKVDLVVSRFSPRVQAIIDSITYLLGLGVCAIIIWRNLEESIVVMQLDLTTSLLRVPNFPFFWVLVLGYAVLCLVMITHLIQHLAKAVKG